MPDRGFAICKKALFFYGEESQLSIAQEEFAELIQAISHRRRGREVDVEEEIADVEIMLEQMKMIFDRNKIKDWKKTKLERLRLRIESGEHGE